MTLIQSLKLKKFKSFNEPTHIEFRPGLNCIVGANGSGKSNVLDSISFALGQLSSKTLRADNYADLIYKKKGGEITESAEVSFELDNKNKELPIDTSIVQVSRIIHPNGSTQYKVNNQNATRQQVVDFLAHAKINPDGHNIIVQGDVSRFIDMKPIERRQIIEEIAGIQQYEERKQKALTELDKINEKLKEASIILREKETYISGLYEEKKEAEKYRSFTQELTGAKATRVRLELEKINHNKNLNENSLKELDSKITGKLSEINKLNNSLKETKKNIELVEKEIEKRGGEEQLNLQKTIEKLKIQLESSKNLVEHFNKELDKIKQRREQLSKDYEELNRQIKAADNKKLDLEKQKKALNTKLASMKKSANSDSESMKAFQIELENIDKEIDTNSTRREELATLGGKLNTKREVLFFQIKDIEKRIKEASDKQEQIAQISKDKSHYRDLITNINDFVNQDGKLAEDLKILQRDKMFIDEKIASLRTNSQAVQELIKRDRAVNTLLKEKIKGVIGTVAQLGEAPSKYSTALKIAAGSKLKYIVVDDESTAIKCLTKLKESKSGVATFLPLNKIRGGQKIKIGKHPGVHGLASELIKHDKKYNELFSYVFGNTIVVEDTNTAKEIGIGKYKMVTLEGDLFQTSGAISGGFIKKDVGLGFQDEELQGQLDVEMKVRKRLESQIETVEKERAKLEEKVMALRREKAELEGKIDSAGLIGDVNTDQLVKEQVELSKELESIEFQKKESEKESEYLAKQIALLKSKKEKLSTKLKAIQFGEKNDELRKLEEQDHQISSDLAIVSAQLENGLIPGQKNHERVLKELSKSEVEFVKQADQKAKEIISVEKDLKKRESEEQSFFGELKTLFKKKSDLKEETEKVNEDLNKSRSEVDISEKERNEITIGKAKIESKLSGLQEELAQLGNSASLSYLKSVTAALQKVKELDEKIATMGNVNMKALEIYEGLKKEYDDLSWKVKKLDSEKEEVHKVIREVESKKKGTFMDTFTVLEKNFLQIYEKMTSKDASASLVLENVEDPFAGGVQVRIKQENKQMSANLLSGGEKVIVALALIFAIQEFNPAPFYLLDEVDAALDNVNSEKIAKLLKEYSSKAQIIMISHNDALVSAADYLYGVSMNKEGTSKVVSLEL